MGGAVWTGDWSWIACAVVVLVVACGDDGSGGMDAGAADAATGDAGGAVGPAPTAAPDLLPCATGWREVAGPPATCEPWPDPLPTCSADEALFPGEPGCVRIGDACPTGEWPEGLPTDRAVVYARAGASAGGTGTPTEPFATINAALGAGPAGAVIAIGRGTYDEVLRVRDGLALWGACVAETIVGSSTVSTTVGTIDADGTSIGVRNLQLGGGRRPGIWAHRDASVDVSGVLVDGAAAVGVLVSLSSMTGSELVVRATEPDQVMRTVGRGFDVASGADVDLDRVAVERNSDAAVFGSAPMTSLRIRAMSVVDTTGQEIDDAFGWGVVAQDGATIDVEAVAIERNRGLAAAALGPGALLRLSDAVVRDTGVQRNDALGGRGLNAGPGGRVEATRVLVERSSSIGVMSITAGSDVALADAVIRDTVPREPDGNFGRGLEVENGANATLARVLLTGNHDAGILVGGAGSSLVGEDLTVSGSLPNPLSFGGRGLHAQLGARVQVDRVVSSNNGEASVSAASAQTEVVLVDVRIEHTLEAPCRAGDCGGSAFGIGLSTLADARVRAERFVVTRSALAGVQVARGGVMDLSVGRVSDNPIGANVQTEGFDIARLTDRVAYVDNDIDLDTSTLPVPELGSPIGP